eukprot:m.199987 g.199987  ORF g.199987 m.199987 type:complete len:89 (-) comp32757_c5_seq3:503-769(-)
MFSVHQRPPQPQPQPPTSRPNTSPLLHLLKLHNKHVTCTQKMLQRNQSTSIVCVNQTLSFYLFLTRHTPCDGLSHGFYFDRLSIYCLS